MEPQPLLLEKLQQRFAGNPRVRIVGKALAAEHQVLNMSICSQAPTISTCSEEWKRGRFSNYTWDQQVSVEATTLDALIKEFGVPDYCKVDVEGFEFQVISGLKSRVPLLSFEFTREFVDNAEKCTAYLDNLGNFEYNYTHGENKKHNLPRWCSSRELFQSISSHADPLLWGDIYARQITKKSEADNKIRLHLGCGKNYLEGYINVDFPIEQREIESVKADLYADITTLNYPAGSVDEIRLHHVFEHFSRVLALAQLIRWHEWLKPGGKLHIETPDIEGSARILLSDHPWHVKSATIRHLAGDQASQWAYHVDHWCPERFKRTLSKLGFVNIETTSTQWPHEPYLANVTVTAFKQQNQERSALLDSAYEILSESAVNSNEKPLVHLWGQQLLNYISDNTTGKDQFDFVQSDTLSKFASNLPLDEIHLFNQRTRDRWVAQKASVVMAGSRVLDVGAGTGPYRSLFTHCDYKTQDFKQFTGHKRDGGTEYGTIDYESDITAIPVPDASFDVVLCTEVLEHVPEPSAALKEMARIIRPGGRIFLTVPLGSGLHQLPYHYYGGLSPTWYKYWGEKFGLSVEEITPNGGFFRLLAQECVRAASFLPQSHLMSQADKKALEPLLSENLPRILFALEDEVFIDKFTVGYHVELQKPLVGTTTTHAGLNNSATTSRYHQLMTLKQSAMPLQKNQG